MNPPGPRFRFGHRDRLHGRKAFAAVQAGRCRKHAGPLTVLSQPNGLDHCRLGLTVSRRVGGAVVRNRIKRLLREAFRLTRHQWPVGYDLVIIVHRHRTATLDDYRRLLTDAVRSSHAVWQRRTGRDTG